MRSECSSENALRGTQARDQLSGRGAFAQVVIRARVESCKDVTHPSSSGKPHFILAYAGTHLTRMDARVREHDGAKVCAFATLIRRDP
jgi:hypothetical protein